MRYDTINLAVIGTALPGLGHALAVPGADSTSNKLMGRDTELLTVDINPDWTNPECSTSKKVTIDWSTDQKGRERGECIKLKKLITAERESDWFGGFDVDLVATTSEGGKYTDPWPGGKKEHTRIIFALDAGERVDLRYSATQMVAGKLIVDSPTAGRVANPQVFMGVTTDAKGKSQKCQYIYCYE